jgi:phage tail-like protein
MGKSFKQRFDLTKLVIAIGLLCVMVGFSARAQTKPEKLLDAEAVTALIEELTNNLPDLIEDEAQVTAITEKWNARQNLAGKTRTEILNLFFADVRSVVSDKKTQDIVWSSWKEINLKPEDEEKPAPKPESKPAPNPATDWKQPKFRFEVEFVDSKIKLDVTEILGLDIEAQPIEYKAGNSKELSTVKMPGITKTGQVTLKKGIFARDNVRFLDWYKQIKSDSIRRVNIIIRLLDEDGQPTMVWTLNSAQLVNVEADGTSINSMVIEYQGLTVENKD